MFYNVLGLPKENMPKAGDVMSVNNEECDKSPPGAVEEFTAAGNYFQFSSILKSLRNFPFY